MVISGGINRWETVEPVEVSTSGKQVVSTSIHWPYTPVYSGPTPYTHWPSGSVNQW